jgi:methyltransferase
MLAEGAVRGAPPAAAIGAGLAVFVLAKGLKWWAIVSLGPAWTFRVVIVPGAPLVTSGPYRWMRHPNYIAIVGELMSVAVLTGAVVAGPLVTLAFGALVAKRIAVETRALDAILPRR